MQNARCFNTFTNILIYREKNFYIILIISPVGHYNTPFLTNLITPSFIL